jgi:hypothetical protein
MGEFILTVILFIFFGVVFILGDEFFVGRVLDRAVKRDL